MRPPELVRVPSSLNQPGYSFTLGAFRKATAGDDANRNYTAASALGYMHNDMLLFS